MNGMGGMGGGMGGKGNVDAVRKRFMRSDMKADEDGPYLDVKVQGDGQSMPMQGMDMMEMGEDDPYAALSDAGKQAYDAFLEQGRVPSPQELEAQGLSPEEADEVADLLAMSFPEE